MLNDLNKLIMSFEIVREHSTTMTIFVYVLLKPWWRNRCSKISTLLRSNGKNWTKRANTTGLNFKQLYIRRTEVRALIQFHFLFWALFRVHFRVHFWALFRVNLGFWKLRHMSFSKILLSPFFKMTLNWRPDFPSGLSLLSGSPAYHLRPLTLQMHNHSKTWHS